MSSKFLSFFSPFLLMKKKTFFSISTYGKKTFMTAYSTDFNTNVIDLEVSSLVNFVFILYWKTFAGFIMMCPQLFINYKLKSVAHLPWRQMTYKFLNTIIDDLFAFVIKMPTLHRLSVFRDGKFGTMTLFVICKLQLLQILDITSF